MDFVIEHAKLFAGLWIGLGSLAWWIDVRYRLRRINILDLVGLPLVMALGLVSLCVIVYNADNCEIKPFKEWED